MPDLIEKPANTRAAHWIYQRADGSCHGMTMIIPSRYAVVAASVKAVSMKQFEFPP